MRKKVLYLMAALSVFVIVSCSPGRRDHVKLRERSAGTSLLQYCKSIEVIPLKGDLRTGSLSNMDMDISGEHYVIQDGDSVLRSFSLCGELESSYTCNKKITSFSAYNSSTVDVLAGRDIFTWNPRDNTQQKITEIDVPGLELRSIARREDRLLVMMGCQGKEERSCQYDLENNGFYNSPADPSIDATYPHVFLRYDNQLYGTSLYNGEIWRFNEFRYRVHHWKFDGGTIDPGAFRNAQMTPANVYLAFRWKDDEYLLIYNRQTYKTSLVGKTKEGVPLPLGVIRGGANYFYCPVDMLDQYLNASVLNEDTAELISNLPQSCKGVIIKYQME